MRSTTMLAAVLLLSIAAVADESNLLKNGGFEHVKNGSPDGWRTAGSATVKQRAESGTGRAGGRCAKLVCTGISGDTPATHVMLAQHNVVAIKKGKWYRLRLWAKQQGIRSDAVQIAVNRTKPWGAGTKSAGSFQPTDEWREYEFQFCAIADVPADASRFQLWHHSVGTLWLDDMVLQQIPRPVYTPLNVVPPGPGRNRIPNASFECGPAGWGSIGKIRTWGGNLLQLFGEIDPKTAAHGQHSLKIHLGPKNYPIFYFDYFEMYRDRVRSITTVNLGWLEVEKGATYVLSAMMKTATPGTKVRMRLERMGHADLTLTTEWKRYTMARKALGDHTYVGFELDLPEQGLDEATVWLDAVQLERSASVTEFAPYAPVEAHVCAKKPMNVFALGEPVELMLRGYNDTDARGSAAITLQLKDFFDRPAGRQQAAVPLPAHRATSSDLRLPIERRGFYRVDVTAQCGEARQSQTVRVAVIEPYAGKDSMFGVNHAYPWDDLMELKRMCGTVWTRDWSIKWHDVEPEKGRFDYNEADHQIDRPIRLGDHVLGLLPFPSSNWSTTAPADHKASSKYRQARERVAFKPRDVKEFEDYVARTVEHYKGRIHYWEILNEPLYTSYAVPARFGHTPKDYVTLLKHAYQTIKRVDPSAKVIGGIANPGGPWFEKIFEEGALDYMDYLNTHTYPGVKAPERTEAKMLELNRWMDAKGKRKKMWCTEYAYYADDDMPARPMRFEMPFVQSEKRCAAYFVRISAIMFAHGTEKLFYNAGTCGRANTNSFEGFLYKYAGVRKVYTAIAAMANIFGDAAHPEGKLEAPDGVWGFLFRTPRTSFAMLWNVDEAARTVTLKDERLQLLDIQGNPVGARTVALDECPVYVIGAGLSPKEVRDALGLR